MNLSISDGVGERLSAFLEALGKHLWDSRQRASFAMYVLGLLSEQPRKSVESIATLFATTPEEADVIHQRLLNFLASAPWPDGDVRRTAVSFALPELLRRAPLQSLIIDDTSFPKSGSNSVGVQRQYCGVGQSRQLSGRRLADRSDGAGASSDRRAAVSAAEVDRL